MFSANPYIGVLLAVIFICFCLWLVMKYTKAGDDNFTLIFKFLVIGLFSVWVVDNVIAFKIQLLSDEENKEIFSMLKYITTTVLGANLMNKANKKDKNETP